MNNKTPNTRIFTAIILSLIFIVPYMYFFAPQTELNGDANATIQSVNNINNALDSAPNATDSTNTPNFEATSAPSNSNAPSAPDSKIQNASAPNAPISDDLTKIISVVKSDKVEFHIDEFGRIHKALLKEHKFANDDGTPLNLFDDKSIKPLELRFQNKEVNAKAFSRPYSADTAEVSLDKSTAKQITLTQNLGEITGLGAITIKKILRFYDDFSYDIKITLNKPLNYYVANGSRPVADSSAYVFKGVIVKKSDETLEKIEEGDDIKGENTAFSNAHFIASADRYYTTLLFNKSGAVNAIVDTGSAGNHLSYIYLTDSAEFSGYIGPKNYKDLKAIAPSLTDVVEYGIITFFAKPLFLLLAWLFGIFANWGWAIIGLTLIVRIVLYPLTYKGMVSMQKLKDLTPKMKEIQEKYKGDAQKMQLHIMELYKKHKVNPMGGCLPLLLQIPVFFAIYRVLYNAVELKDAAWLLWVKDLSAMDPYFILPILMGGSMYLQQKLSPTTFNDPMQEKIFKFLPLVFTIFLITFPAGLMLYWTVNNIFSILQQMIINKMMAKRKALEIAEHSAESSVKSTAESSAKSKKKDKK
ncbi:membrane protein insertase YidC [Helicobacter sp. 23-1045]